MSLKILHVSDIHFGASDHLGEQPRITEALIEAVHGATIRPDICVFSGDLVHSGTKEQYEAGRHWLRRLIAPDWNTDLVIVPGNHDITRADTRRHLFRQVASDIDTYNDWRTSKQLGCSHLDNFLNWHKDAKTTLPLRGEWNNIFGFRYKKDDLSIPVHLIGLNSSLFCCDESDKGNLVIDMKSLNEHLAISKREGGLIIAVAHHPIDHLKPWNREHIERLLSQETGVHLFLHGHLHDQSVTSTADSRGSRLTRLSAGAAYQDARWPQYFSFYSIDFSNREIESQVYNYSPNSGEWVYDGLRSGTVVSDIPQFPTTFSDAAPIHTRRSSRPPRGQQATTHHEHLQNEAYRYRDAARDVQSRLLPLFQSTKELFDLCYALKYRIKKHDRIMAKLEDRRKNDGDYSISKMADICGFRIVVLYNDQIPIAMKTLLRTIKNNASSYDPSFKADYKIEIDFNTARRENDPLSLTKTIREIVESSGLATNFVERARETGYSSIHIRPISRVPAGDHELEEMQIEIQVRSAFEDIWGEIDWKLRYGEERGGLGVTSKRHLNVFKGMIDSLVNYVDLIKVESEREEVVEPPSESKMAKTVYTPKEQLKALEGLPDDMMSSLEQAYTLWKRADATLKVRANIGLITKAADAFESLRTTFADQPKNNPRLAEEFLFTVEIELAYLLMLTGDEDDLTRAGEVYNAVLGRRPNDGTAHYRLGSMYRRMKVYERALTHLMRSLDILERSLDKRISKRHWLYDQVRLGLALTKWRMFSDEFKPSEERRRLISSSIELALDVLERPADLSSEEASETLRYRLQAINDLLYYIWDADRVFGDTLDHPIKGQRYNEVLDEFFLYVSTREDINWLQLDTAARAFRRDKKRVVPIALKLEDELEKLLPDRPAGVQLPSRGTLGWVIVVARDLDEDQGDALTYCQEILKEYGRSSP